MAETLGIVSASLGLVPILVEAIRGYRTLKETLRFIQTCTKELNAIHLMLDVQETRFLNDAIAALVDNPEHVGWQDESLKGLLEACFGNRHSRSYASCTKAIIRMKTAQAEVEQQLTAFNQIRTETQSNESFRSAYRRLRQTISLKFNKKDIERALEQFRSANDDLVVIHSQIARFQGNKREMILNSPPRSLPRDVCRTHEMAKEAYSALSSTFTCKEVNHIQHWATLCMEQEVINTEKLKLALSYAVGTDSEVTSTEPDTRAKAPPKKIKTRTLRFSDDADEKNTIMEEVQMDSALPNLSYMQDICNFLGEKCKPEISESGFQRDLGYLRASYTCRHVFYVSPSTPIISSPHAPETTSLIRENSSLKDLFHAVKVDEITLDYQLSWAIKLALVVLQFHSTPWLHDEWRTSDLLLPDLDPSIAVKPSLLLRTALPTRVMKAGADLAMASSISDISSVADDEEYGIYNRPLWGLGVALLEVAHWKSLDQMLHQPGPKSNESGVVRRLSKQQTLLGNSYNLIARTCLQCNFGCDNDMSAPELQNAVYAKVVCPLTDMKEAIGKLERLSLKVGLP
ncbi:hypothetical protein E8E14_007770 [Neopestalotiopsis sp. 37M]|nr:hypothetical protein E8E14_007770 [Neopestalotiopsis sp. 37M]